MFRKMKPLGGDSEKRNRLALVGDFVFIMGKYSYVALKVCRKYRLVLMVINLVWGS